MIVMAFEPLLFDPRSCFGMYCFIWSCRSPSCVLARALGYSRIYEASITCSLTRKYCVSILWLKNKQLVLFDELERTLLSSKRLFDLTVSLPNLTCEKQRVVIKRPPFNGSKDVIHWLCLFLPCLLMNMAQSILYI